MPRFWVRLDGRASVAIDAASMVDAAEQFALADTAGWEGGHYRDDDAVVLVVDDRGAEAAYHLDGDDVSFAAWYLPESEVPAETD